MKVKFVKNDESDYLEYKVIKNIIEMRKSIFEKVKLEFNSS